MQYSEIIKKVKHYTNVSLLYWAKSKACYKIFMSHARLKAQEASDSETAHKTRHKLISLRAWWIENFVKPTNHIEIENHVISEGMMSARFAFMVVTSCAIAILGLLLSSPAVVIGAMLISPLMSPIVSLGFSLCWLDLSDLKQSLITLIYGVLLALGVSWLIVTFSPITDATPEILARTKPNLFDLLVAIFSGMAAGYSVIKQKGETIVGVAIATALMPPLAVTGFGLATGDVNIAQGSFMLFMTNLLAISLTVALVAKLYGFSDLEDKKHTIWQMFFIFAVFAVLSLPLGVALKTIAYQTYITKTSQNILRQFFETGNNKSRITSFNINFPHDATVNIDTVILTSHYKAKAEIALKNLLKEKTNADITLSLDQVVVAQEEINQKITEPKEDNTVISNRIPQSNIAAPLTVTASDTMIENLKKSIFFPTEYIEVNNEQKQANIYAKPLRGVTIATLHQIEDNLKVIYPEWQIHIIPPMQAFPYIIYHQQKIKLSPKEFNKLKDILWSLNRWNIQNIEIVAFVKTLEEFKYFGKKLPAHQRSVKLKALFERSNIQASITHELYKLEYLNELQATEQQPAIDYITIRVLPITDKTAPTQEGKNVYLPMKHVIKEIRTISKT